MVLNVLLLIIIVTVGVSLMAFNNRAIMDKLLFIPYDCKHNGRYSRIITHIFIHADWGHLLFNMMSLYFLGANLLSGPEGMMYEYGSVMGQFHFIVLYFLGALFATLIPYARNQDNPSYRSLGASGAVSAVIFGAIIWDPSLQIQIIFIPFAIPAYIFGPLYLLYEFYADKRGGTGIAHDAHIGGAIFGIAYVLIINFHKGKEFIDIIFG